MREKLALLLIIGVVAAISVVNAQQRSCAVPTADVPESPDEGTPWNGEQAKFLRVLGTSRR